MTCTDITYMILCMSVMTVASISCFVIAAVTTCVFQVNLHNITL